MSVAHLLDHDATVWRKVSTLGPLREERRDYEPILAIRVAVNSPRAPVASAGPGLAPTGERLLYTEPQYDIQPRDVIELTDGPNAPGAYEVDDLPHRPRGHHSELRCRVFNGTLPVTS